MDIYCTRPHCEHPLNSFTDLDDSKFFNTGDGQHCYHCGMPLILDGRYAPLKLLKQDDLSATFLSCDLFAPDKYYTIEQLYLDPSFNVTQLEIATGLFCREAEILEKLGEHPKIPRLLAFLELTISSESPYRQQKFFYLIQEYIDGQSLDLELQSKGRFVESEVVFVLREVARILEFVHFQDTIHRDIKPANIIRDRQGKIYLVNFGAVKQIVAETIRSTERVVERNSITVFTLEYAPGKQHQKQEIYPSSDLYSLAVTCLNLLTGKAPQDLLDVDTNNWQWRTPDLQVSDALAQILDKMLQPLPTDRFLSARDVLDALDTIWGLPIVSISALNMPDSSTLALKTVDRDPPPQIDDDMFEPDDELSQLFGETFAGDDDLFLPLEHAPLQIVNPANTPRKTPWIFAGVVAAGIVGLIAMIIPKFLPSSHPEAAISDVLVNRSSAGERILLGFEGSRDTDRFKELKRAGVAAIANKNYAEAATKLKSALIENPNSPETRIYLNNALVGDRKSYTVAAAVPIDRSLDRASEMLRGFAQAQTEINQVGDVNEPKIKLRIIDDSDDPKAIENIANAVVEQPEILGIVGHSRNDISIKAANIYNRHKLAFIAPISTSSKLTGTNKPYIFRTNTKGDSIAKKLVDRLIDKEHKRRVAIFYVPNIATNDEFKTQFVNKLTARGGTVVGTFAFSTVSATASPTTTTTTANTFDAETYLSKVNEMGAEAILLLPVGRSTREALQILKIKASKYPAFTVFSDTTLYNLNTLNAGKEAEGLIIGVPWQESESTPQFSAGAKQLWNNRVNWATATSYNALKALGTAIKNQSTPSRAGVMQILSKREFMGASGRFQFTQGEPTERFILVEVSPTPPHYKYSSKTGYDFVPIEWLF